MHVFDAALPVAAGHYRPAHQPLARIEAVAAAAGVGHLVLVQPSVYGHDNGLLLQALRSEPGRHRGIVVLGDDLSDATLSAMHEAGVRGARLNLVSPVGETSFDVETRFALLAPRLRAFGWHLQWYVAPSQLALIARLHAGSGVTAVLDHLGGLHARLPPSDLAWLAIRNLADQGAWVKLSGWYRLQSTEPYGELLEPVRRLAGCFGERMVWGSDWPHTRFEPDALPDYASTWRPVQQALGAGRSQALLAGAGRLYEG